MATLDPATAIRKWVELRLETGLTGEQLRERLGLQENDYGLLNGTDDGYTLSTRDLRTLDKVSTFLGASSSRFLRDIWTGTVVLDSASVERKPKRIRKSTPEPKGERRIVVQQRSTPAPGTISHQLHRQAARRQVASRERRIAALGKGQRRTESPHGRAGIAAARPAHWSKESKLTKGGESPWHKPRLLRCSPSGH